MPSPHTDPVEQLLRAADPASAYAQDEQLRHLAISAGTQTIASARKSRRRPIAIGAIVSVAAVGVGATVAAEPWERDGEQQFAIPYSAHKTPAAASTTAGSAFSTPDSTATPGPAGTADSVGDAPDFVRDAAISVAGPNVTVDGVAYRCTESFLIYPSKNLHAGVDAVEGGPRANPAAFSQAELDAASAYIARHDWSSAFDGYTPPAEPLPFMNTSAKKGTQAYAEDMKFALEMDAGDYLVTQINKTLAAEGLNKNGSALLGPFMGQCQAVGR